MRLYYCYSEKDADLRGELAAHLALLQRQGVIDSSHDRCIAPGLEEAAEINRLLDAADIILLLVSADLLASDRCFEVEVRRAMERHRAGEARVIPVLLRPVAAWRDASFGDLAPLPRDGRPITEWPDRDRALADVAEGIRQVALALRTARGGPRSPGTREREDRRPRHLPRDPRQLYLEWRSEDVANRLKTSIHEARRLDLGLQEEPGAVRPWTYQAYEPDRQPLRFQRFEEALAQYRGRLLVLGPPGSGKTTILLDVCQRLLAEARADQDAPVPLLFSLSQWEDEREPIEKWLARLTARLPAGVRRGTAGAWVREDRVALLLDGLDEVPPERRPAAVAALNEYLAAHPATLVVVCSRSEDYALLQARPARTRRRRDEAQAHPGLRLNGAVTLQPLTVDQIDAYLQAARAPALREVMPRDDDLRELAASPLTLSMMTLAYGDLPKEALPPAGTPLERRRHLFSTYVDRMMQRAARRAAKDTEIHPEERDPAARLPTRYSLRDVNHYLGWLGVRLSEQGRTVFPLRRIYQFLEEGDGRDLWSAVSLTNAVASFLLCAVMISVFLLEGRPRAVTRLQLLIAALLTGLLGLVLSFSVRWVRSTQRQRRPELLQALNAFGESFLIAAFLHGFLLGATTLADLLSPGPPKGLLAQATASLLGGFLSGMLLARLLYEDHPDAALLGGICGCLFPTLVTLGGPPGGLTTLLVCGMGAALGASATGILAPMPRQPRGMALGIAAVGILLWMGSFHLAFTRLHNARISIFTVGMVAFWINIAIATLFRDQIYDFLKGRVFNALARFILVVSGSVPRDYGGFLLYCVDALLLKKVGAEYEFMHRLLRDHFALLELMLRLAHPDAAVRVQAVRSLERLGPTAREALTAAAQDPDPEVAGSARGALAALSP